MLDIPTTRRENVTETLHGVTITDPYRWLEDQESPETRAWLQTQIDYTRQVLGSYAGREDIRCRLAELMKVDSTTAPVCRQGAYFFSHRGADEQQYVICRRRGLEGVNEPLIDPKEMGENDGTSVSLYDVSRDGSLIVYAVRRGGADEQEIRLRDTETLKDLPDRLPAGRYMGVGITHDIKTLYYSLVTPAGPRVRAHRIGTKVEDDVEIFGQNIGPEKIIGIEISEDGGYLIAVVYHGSAGTKTEIHIAELSAGPAFRTIVDSLDARFNIYMAGRTLYLRTNWNGPNGRVFKLDVDVNPNSPDEWEEIVPSRDGAILQSISPVGGKLYLNYLENVSSRIVTADKNGTTLGGIELPGIGTASGPYGRWDSSEAFYTFSSFAVPGTVYRYDTDQESSLVWAKMKTPIDANSIEVSQVYVTSKDGASVPMFLVYKKGLEKDCERLVYLTGYGGFTLSRTPAFSAVAALWAERGGIFALPNLRGGGEFGEEWHRAGMLGRKQNTFDDFYAAAQWLIDAGYTRPQKIGIFGRSNGGLLVGAAITQRPELFGAAVCGYPLLDMIRYHKFLVAGYWVPEYGSSEDAEQFKYIHAYSPYHNVRPGVCTPPIMFVTGDSDTRVAPLHARKMAALLQAESGSSPAILHYDVSAGHSEGRPVDEIVNDTADELLFLYANLE